MGGGSHKNYRSSNNKLPHYLRRRKVSMSAYPIGHQVRKFREFRFNVSSCSVHQYEFNHVAFDRGSLK